MTNHRLSVTISPELSAWLETWRGTLPRSTAARILLEQGMALHRDHRLADNLGATADQSWRPADHGQQKSKQ